MLNVDKFERIEQSWQEEIFDSEPKHIKTIGVFQFYEENRAGKNPDSLLVLIGQSWYDTLMTHKYHKSFTGIGVFDGITNEDYHAADAISKSYLAKLDICPAEALTPFGESGAMNIGTACHLLALEGPTAFNEQVMECSVKGSTSKAYKEACAANPDMIVLTLGGRDEIINIVEGLKANPQIKKLLDAPGLVEHSVFWKDKGTGLSCKCRPDKLMLDQKIVLDLKFLRAGASMMKKFSWAIKDFGYDMQAAWYTEGILRATGVLCDQFLFPLCENVAPHRTDIWIIDEDHLGDKMFQNHKLLELEVECRKTGKYPNYDPRDTEVKVYAPFTM